jgi:hypothetical protein
MAERALATLITRAPDRATATVLQAAATDAATARGDDPVLFLVDRRREQTRVRIIQGPTTLDERKFPTPESHGDLMIQLTQANNDALGYDDHPDAVVVSTTERVSRGGQIPSAVAAKESETFRQSVGHATRMPNERSIAVLPRVSALALAQSIDHPAGPQNDVAFLAINARRGLLERAAVYTHEGWVASHEPEGEVRGSLIRVMGNTYDTLNKGGLEVATLVVDGAESEDTERLQAGLRQRFRVTAPRLVRAAIDEDTALKGAQVAAGRIAKGQPFDVFYAGVKKIVTTREAH